MPYVYSAKPQLPPYLFFVTPETADDEWDPTKIQVFLPLVLRQEGVTLTVDPFEFGPIADATLPYRIVIRKETSAWRFDGSPVRQGLRAAFVEFLRKLEEKGFRPGGFEAVVQAVAGALPLTYAETLLYRHGFDAVRGVVDLQPGMRLRVEYQVRQLVGPTPEEQLLNGFVGNGSSTWAVTGGFDAEGRRTVGFDPFLASLARTVVAPNQGGGAGVLDLQRPGFARPFYRLLYPSDMVSADSLGAIGPEKNVVLLGADSFTDLEQATDLYLQQGNFTGLGKVAVTTFRGRTTLTPEIPIFRQRRPKWVPLGTTLRQALGALSAFPLTYRPLDAASFSLGRSLGHLFTALDQVTRPLPLLRYTSVNFNRDFLSQTYADGSDRYDLPLLGGDTLEVTLPTPQPSGDFGS